MVENSGTGVAQITEPDGAALDQLCNKLRELGPELDKSGDWPAEQLRLCGEYGVFRWFVAPEFGGVGWHTEAIMRGYMALASACLTTTFIITQRSGACGRIGSSANEFVKQSLLADLAAGNSFASVGISHLTTSRRHLTRPVLRAERVSGGFLLEGFSPWVTGAAHAQHVVVGASLMVNDEPTKEELLIALPTDLPGVVAPPPAKLLGVSSSHTGELRMDRTFVDDQWVLAGPLEEVMSQGIGAGTGGFQTSALAVGLAAAAIDFLQEEAARRETLNAPLDALKEEHTDLREALLAGVRGEPNCSTEALRQRANSLALRSAQASLAAAKGTGYILGHPAGRWCREALFFLVWSCPQPVVAANLCELAGIAD